MKTQTICIKWCMQNTEYTPLSQLLNNNELIVLDEQRHSVGKDWSRRTDLLYLSHCLLGEDPYGLRWLLWTTAKKTLNDNVHQSPLGSAYSHKFSCRNCDVNYSVVAMMNLSLAIRFAHLHFFNYFLWSALYSVIDPLPLNSCHVSHKIVRNRDISFCYRERNAVPAIVGAWLRDFGANNHHRKWIYSSPGTYITGSR